MKQLIRCIFRKQDGTSVLLAAIIVFLLFSCTGQKEEDKSSGFVRPDTSVTESGRENLFMGIPFDSFLITKGTIKPNRFLSDILIPYGVTQRKLDSLLDKSKNIFDARKLRAYHNYTILTCTDSNASLKYFIYEHEPGISYIFSFNDSLSITEWREEEKSLIKFTSFTIETSLWDAMKSSGAPFELAGALSDIFAWTVDFFGLKKGDSFRVIYEEKHIGDKTVTVGRIHGASYTSGTLSYYAIPFIQGETESYYDADGTSLRKAFLKSPLKFSRITSRFSSGRMHPVLKIVRPHYGVDYAAPVGTPVYSIGDGRVTETGSDGEAGRYVKIRHNSVYSTAYLHLSGYGRGIMPGASVRQGDVIGYVGSSGLSTGPHLDFRFYKNGYPVDPLKVEAPPVEPVFEENLEKFRKISSVLIRIINQIE